MSYGSTAGAHTGVAVTELVKAEVCGLEVFVDTVRYEEGSSQLWLLSLSGQASAVRGAWANLTGFHSFLKLVDSDKLLSLAGGGMGWRSLSSRVGDPKRLGRAWEHMVLLPPCTTTWGDLAEMLVVEGGGRIPAATLMQLLAMRSSLPLESGWADQAWTWAIESGAAVELSGCGPRSWLVRLSDKRLLEEFLPRFATITPADDGAEEIAA